MLSRNDVMHSPAPADGLAQSWRPQCLKLRDWPAMDRRLWEAGCASDELLEVGHGAKLCADSRQKTIKGYGAWLSFLQAQGWLDRERHPADRITRDRLLAYFEALRGRHNRSYSILGRFAELRMAMKVMAPDHDTRFILKPNGVTIRRMLAPHCRPMVVPDAGVLFQWGISIMDNAKLEAPRRHGLVAYRDGLLIAMLASRGRRLRSMALLRLGQEFIRYGERYRVELQPEQVKTQKYDTFDLPDRLTPYIQKYLDTVRPALLRDNVHCALWVGIDGRPLLAKGIQGMICVRSRTRFGVTFGPHRFRHAIATTAPLRDPTRPGLAAPLLGISNGVIQTHYNRANQVAAVQRFQSILELAVSAEF